MESDRTRPKLTKALFSCQVSCRLSGGMDLGPQASAHVSSISDHSKHDLLAPWVRIGLGHSRSGDCHGLCLGDPKCYSIVIRYPSIQWYRITVKAKKSENWLSIQEWYINQHFSILACLLGTELTLAEIHFRSFSYIFKKLFKASYCQTRLDTRRSKPTFMKQ